MSIAPQEYQGFSHEFHTSAWVPEIVYRGKEGYDRMINEISESLYKEIPDAKGSIEIFNHLANPDEELQRIAESLNTNVLDLCEACGFANMGIFMQNTRGHSLSGRLENGRYVAISAGWDPDDHFKNLDDIKFEDVEKFARIITHETLHCLDPWIQEGGTQFGDFGWILAARAHSRGVEMLADTGAQDLFLRNGASHEATDKLRIKYDSTGMFRKGINDDNGPCYDNGPFFQRLLDEQPSGPGINNFRFKGWKETLDKMQDWRANGPPEISMESTIITYNQSIALIVYRDQILEKLEEKISPHAEKVAQEVGYNNIHYFVDSMLDDMDFRAWKNGDYDNAITDPDLRDVYQAIYDAKVEMGNWMEENKALFPDAARAASAIRYITGQQETHISTPPPSTSELTTDMLMARHWMKFEETGDPIYKRAANGFAKAQRHRDIYAQEIADKKGLEETQEKDEEPKDTLDRRQIMQELFEDNPQLVRAIANGVPVSRLVEEQPDGHYGTVEHMDEIINTHKTQSEDNQSLERPQTSNHQNPINSSVLQTQIINL